MTNRDRKDSIRVRMAEAGEPFNVARRKAEAAAAGPVPEAEFQESKRTGRCDLSDRELAALPPKIGQLTNLRTLWLDDNRLTALPREVADLLSGGLVTGLHTTGGRVDPPAPGIEVSSWAGLGRKR